MQVLSSSRIVFALVGLLAGLSCASHNHTPYLVEAGANAHTRAPVNDVVAGSGADRPPVVIDNHVEKRSADYTLCRLTFPSVGDNGQVGNIVSVDYHQAGGSGAKPAVIVLPIWGISTYPPRAVTKKILRASDGAVHVLEVQGVDQIMKWADLLVATDEESYLAAWEASAEREKVWITDMRRLVDWAEERPEIDSSRIGLIGFSHSAMTAVMLAAHDQRFAAVVVAMGGARAPEIIAHCQGRRTTPVQNLAESSFGWDAAELERRLESVFSGLNPVEYRDALDPRRVLVFDARDDPCVSPKARQDLWVALGRPERYTIHSTHRKAFLSMTFLGGNWMQRRVWEFFERTLLSREGAVPPS